MFSNLKIELVGKFCKCIRSTNLTWDVVRDAQQKMELHIACKLCTQKLVVPSALLYANTNIYENSAAQPAEKKVEPISRFAIDTTDETKKA